jgi:hypothetical protein
VPALDEDELGAPGERLVELLAVAPDREPRVVRGEDEPDDALRACRDRGGRGVGDPRRPVLHPGEHRQAELDLERRPRPLGDLVQGIRVLDPEAPVALGQLGDQLRSNRSPAADVCVVGRNVLDPLRRPVRHQDDGSRHVTVSSRCLTPGFSPSRAKGPARAGAVDKPPNVRSGV